MIIEQALIKVKTLSSRMVSQIDIVRYDNAPDSLHVAIRKAIKAEALKPLGWLRADAVTKSHSARPINNRFWLVEYEGQLRFVIPPDKYGGEVPQLFVS